MRVTGGANRDFTIELKDNALDSLAHGIEHFLADDHPHDLKYGILHVAQAVELFLKARLALEHPLLIYVEPGKAGDDAKTVEMETLILRLQAAGVQIDNKVLDDLRALQKDRNRVQHHRIAAVKADVQRKIGRGLRFLEAFVRDELDIEIGDELDSDLYRAMNEAIYSYEELVKRAQELMKERLPFSRKDKLEYQELECPDCGTETILFPDPSDSNGEGALCTFCNNRFRTYPCLRCGGPVFGKDGFCDPCTLSIQ